MDATGRRLGNYTFIVVMLLFAFGDIVYKGVTVGFTKRDIIQRAADNAGIPEFELKWEMNWEAHLPRNRPGITKSELDWDAVRDQEEAERVEDARSEKEERKSQAVRDAQLDARLQQPGDR
jgi:hypothetical protein